MTRVVGDETRLQSRDLTCRKGRDLTGADETCRSGEDQYWRDLSERDGRELTRVDTSSRGWCVGADVSVGWCVREES
jgi:hypothetical protein